MSSAAENGDAAPGKQNEEKTYKKVSIFFNSERGKLLLLRLFKSFFPLKQLYVKTALVA